jgi:CheY-like chemotaxis protein
MEGDTVNNRRSVLIVDGSEETREVLQTALERRGIGTWTTPHPNEGVELARQHHPDLIVFDLELTSPTDHEFSERLLDYSADPVPIIILGTLRRRCPPLPRGQFVSKPYHFGPLICRIEELLESTRRKEAA